MAVLTIRLQAEPFDPGEELNRFLAAADTAAGAAASFTGIVRSAPDDPIESLTLEHYPALAEAQLQRFGKEAGERFALIALTVIHRHGRMRPGEPIVQVMAMAPHRQAAFDAAAFVMDWLKTDAPFWKKEERATGPSWVKARPEDETARGRWS